MNDFVRPLVLIPALTGLIFLIIGALMMKFPAKAINHLYGYRTSASMRSQEAWDFAQTYSAALMYRGGLMLVVLSGLGFSLPVFAEGIEVVIAIVALLAFVFWLIFSTERELRRRFNGQKLG